MHRGIERIILDECLPSTPELLEEIERLIGNRPIEIVTLAEKYPGLPDRIILERVMDNRSMLVTQDRPLHNLAIDRGFASLLRTPERRWTSGRIALVAQEGGISRNRPLCS
jgi:predicted nuclease of predicted toxin-antitoxin system